MTQANYYIKTFGCQMNYSDSERLSAFLESLSYQPCDQMEQADIIVFNTCSIKQKAEDKALGFMKLVRKLKRKNPKLIMVITGCMIRQSSSRYSVKRDKLFNKVRELDIALRIEDLPKFADLIRELHPEILTQNIPEEELTDYFKIDPNYSSKSQAFVPVSTGCDKFCTYCIVPYSRGREKCRTIEEIFEECQNLVENGSKEITLIGQTVNSYGLNIYDKIQKTFQHLPEGKEPFVYLLEQLDKLKDRGLERVRFTSPHPKDTTDQLIEAMAKLDTQMPWIHMPLQSGDDQILKRMNRSYTIQHYMNIIKKLKKAIPDISISTDIIVGFCGETEEQFMNTYKIFEEVGFDHAYISQYSERKGTFADQNIQDDIPRKVKRDRFHRLNNLLRKISEKKLKKFIGKTLKVLVETKKDGNFIGRSEHFKAVQFKSDQDLIGEIVSVKIVDSKKWILIGETTKTRNHQSLQSESLEEIVLKNSEGV